MACLKYFAQRGELGFPIPGTMQGYKKDPCKCELVELKAIPDVPAETDSIRYHPGRLHFFYQVDDKCCCVLPNSLISSLSRPKGGKYVEFILFDVVPVPPVEETEPVEEPTP